MSAHAWITLGIVADSLAQKHGLPHRVMKIGIPLIALFCALSMLLPAIPAAQMTRPTGCVHTFRFPVAPAIP